MGDEEVQRSGGVAGEERGGGPQHGAEPFGDARVEGVRGEGRVGADTQQAVRADVPGRELLDQVPVLRRAVRRQRVPAVLTAGDGAGGGTQQRRLVADRVPVQFPFDRLGHRLVGREHQHRARGADGRTAFGGGPAGAQIPAAVVGGPVAVRPGGGDGSGEPVEGEQFPAVVVDQAQIEAVAPGDGSGFPDVRPARLGQRGDLPYALHPGGNLQTAVRHQGGGGLERAVDECRVQGPGRLSGGQPQPGEAFAPAGGQFGDDGESGAVAQARAGECPVERVDVLRVRAPGAQFGR